MVMDFAADPYAADPTPQPQHAVPMSVPVPMYSGVTQPCPPLPVQGPPTPSTMQPPPPPAPYCFVPMVPQPMHTLSQPVQQPQHVQPSLHPPMQPPLPTQQPHVFSGPPMVPMPLPSPNMPQVQGVPVGSYAVATSPVAGPPLDTCNPRAAEKAPPVVIEGGTQLHVRAIAQHTTPAELAAAFAPFGEVEYVRIVRDKDTGKSKGFGFVYFRNPADAAAAVMRGNGAQLNGRSLLVEMASPQRPLPRRPEGQPLFES